jgi:excisionase family DNA binding protein
MSRTPEQISSNRHRLDCHTRTVFRLVEDGRLKAYRLGGVLKFRQEDLDHALEPVHASSTEIGDFINQQTKQAAS